MVGAYNFVALVEAALDAQGELYSSNTRDFEVLEGLVKKGKVVFQDAVRSVANLG